MYVVVENSEYSMDITYSTESLEKAEAYITWRWEDEVKRSGVKPDSSTYVDIDYGRAVILYDNYDWWSAVILKIPTRKFEFDSIDWKKINKP